MEDKVSRSLNRVELIGHLGKDIEVKYTAQGTAVGTFSIATSRRWKPKDSQEWKEETDWHRCVVWQCEKLAPYLTKGKQIYLAGRLQTREWEDKGGEKRWTTEVISEDLILLGGADGSGPRAAPHPANAPSDAMGSQGVTDDDVPF